MEEDQKSASGDVEYDTEYLNSLVEDMLSKVQNQRQLAEKRADDLEAELQDQKGRNEQLANQMKEKETEIKDLQQRKLELQQKHDQKIQEIRALKAAHKKELAEAERAKKQELQEQKEQAEKTLAKLREDKERLKAELEKDKNDLIDEIKKQRATVRQRQADELQKDRSIAEKITAKERKIAQLEEKEKGYIVQIRALTEQFNAKLEKQRANYQQQLRLQQESAAGEKTRLNQQLQMQKSLADGYRDAYSRQERDLQEAKENTDNLRVELAQENAKSEAFINAGVQLMRQNNGLQMQLQRIEDFAFKRPQVIVQERPIDRQAFLAKGLLQQQDSQFADKILEQLAAERRQSNSQIEQLRKQLELQRKQIEWQREQVKQQRGRANMAEEVARQQVIVAQKQQIRAAAAEREAQILSQRDDKIRRISVIRAGISDNFRELFAVQFIYGKRDADILERVGLLQRINGQGQLTEPSAISAVATQQPINAQNGRDKNKQQQLQTKRQQKLLNEAMAAQQLYLKDAAHPGKPSQKLNAYNELMQHFKMSEAIDIERVTAQLALKEFANETKCVGDDMPIDEIIGADACIGTDVPGNCKKSVGDNMPIDEIIGGVPDHESSIIAGGRVPMFKSGEGSATEGHGDQFATGDSMYSPSMQLVLSQLSPKMATEGCKIQEAGQNSNNYNSDRGKREPLITTEKPSGNETLNATTKWTTLEELANGPLPSELGGGSGNLQPRQNTADKISGGESPTDGRSLEISGESGSKKESADDDSELQNVRKVKTDVKGMQKENNARMYLNQNQVERQDQQVNQANAFAADHVVAPNPYQPVKRVVLNDERLPEETAKDKGVGDEIYAAHRMRSLMMLRRNNSEHSQKLPAEKQNGAANVGASRSTTAESFSFSAFESGRETEESTNMSRNRTTFDRSESGKPKNSGKNDKKTSNTPGGSIRKDDSKQSGISKRNNSK